MKISKLLLFAAGGIAIALFLSSKKGRNVTSNLSSSAGDLKNKLGDLTKDTRDHFAGLAGKLNKKTSNHHPQDAISS